MDRKTDSNSVTDTDDTLPSVPALLATSFDAESCTIDCAPTMAEQDAYAALRRQCRWAEEFWEQAPAADWMLDLLLKVRRELPTPTQRALREFAVQCCETLDPAGDATVHKLLQVLRLHVAGEATLDDLSAAQAATHADVARAGLEGLPRCSTLAAGRLAAWHAAHRHPLRAAMWSSEFAARHDAFATVAQRAASWQCPEPVGESWRTACFAQMHPDIETAALAEARRIQADLLRSILPMPFDERVRGEVYFGPTNETGRSIFCVTCGFQRADATPGVLFDVRGLLCASCGAPVARCVH